MSVPNLRGSFFENLCLPEHAFFPFWLENLLLPINALETYYLVIATLSINHYILSALERLWLFNLIKCHCSMATKRGPSTESTNGSMSGYTPLTISLRKHWGLTFSLGRSHQQEGLADEISDHEALSTQRLEDFFNNEDFELSSPLSWGRTNKSSATQKMSTKLQAFDEAFNSNDTNKSCASREGDVGNKDKY